MREIRINHPGDGEWIMAQVGAVYYPDRDQSLATHRDGKLLGGFVLNTYYGNMLAVHDAGAEKMWCTRDLMWMLFHYVFVQLKCQKLIAPTTSDNPRAILQNLRAGFQLEAVLHDAVKPGVHLLLLTMGLRNCRWLGILPKQYCPGGEQGTLPHG